MTNLTDEWIKVDVEMKIDIDNRLSVRACFPGSEEWEPATLHWQQFDGEVIHEGPRPVNSLAVHSVDSIDAENVLNDMLTAMDIAMDEKTKGEIQ